MNDWATGIFLKYQFQKLHCQCTFSSQKLELSLPHPSQVVTNYDGLLQEPNTLHLLLLNTFINFVELKRNKFSFET
jgi:hypothetical protein